MKHCRWEIIVAVVGVVILYCVSTLAYVAHWDGRFGQVEYQFTVTDSQGRPIEGIELRVEDDAGNAYHHYPVTDFLTHKIPTTDAQGTMTFHHVNYSGLEFGGRCGHLFGLIPLGDGNAPSFWCVFLRDGKEVHRCRFNDLIVDLPHDAPTVTRDWNWLDNMPDTIEEWSADNGIEQRRKAFDRNDDGKHDIREVAAFHAEADASEQYLRIKHGKNPEVTAEEFFVIAKTIMLE